MSNISINPYQIQALYHTNIRNVALFTSVSLGLLGYSRYYRAKKSQIYNISFIIISLLFLSMSILLCFYLLRDHNKYINILKKSKKYTKKEILLLEKWYIIPKIALVVNSIIIGFGLYTLIREFEI